MKKIEINTDGGARGNPGPAAIGVFIRGDGKVIAQIGKKIGEATNNVAEYIAILEAFDFFLKNKDFLEEDSAVSFFMDSQLIYSQITGLYKIKNQKLKELFLKVKEKEAQIKVPVSYSFVRREENIFADKLVNLALDSSQHRARLCVKMSA